MISTIDESWKPLFFNMDKDFFREIDAMNETRYYPKKQNIFRVFETPLQDIKVVILGQDPYIHPDEAVGLAFAVCSKKSKPPSLQNIEKEIGHEIDRTLIPWMEQGVFLLNTALTVRKGASGTHTELWRTFTGKVINHISKNNPCIWMLWGKHANGFLKDIDNYVFEYPMEDELDKNVVLIAAHPAAESYRDDAGFYGCNHFNKANKALEIQGKVIINW